MDIENKSMNIANERRQWYVDGASLTRSQLIGMAESVDDEYKFESFKTTQSAILILREHGHFVTLKT